MEDIQQELNKAKILLNAKRYDDAKQILESILRQDSENSTAKKWLVTLKTVTGEFSSVEAVPNSPKGASKKTNTGFSGPEAAGTEATRLLAAGAVTRGGSYRRSIIEHFSQQYRAIAPEIGIDSELILRVCKSIDNAERVTWVLYALLVLGLPALPITLLIGGGLVTFFSRWRLDRSFAQYFRYDRYNPEEIRRVFGANLNQQIVSAVPKQDQNLIVYSGFDPYIGAGKFVNGWSIPIDIGEYYDQTKQQHISPKSFEVSDLYTTLDMDLKNLSIGTFSLRDYLFAFGSDARQIEGVLTDILERPNQTVAPHMVTNYMNESDHRVRFYKWICLVDWSGQLAVSFFIRLSKRGHNLFVEFNIYSLSPLQESFYEIDRMGGGIFRMIFSSFLWGWLQTIFAWIDLAKSIPKFLLGWISRGRAERALRNEVKQNLRYDYGVSSSIRERYSASNYTRFFQIMDVELYTKIVQGEVFESIIRFLEKHNVDTASFRGQTTTIINNGTMVQGNVEGSNVAIGANSQASFVQRVGDAVSGVVKNVTGG